MKGTEIDYGKISALHNAGWAGEKIAEELGMSGEEYSGALTDLLDVLNEKIWRLEKKYRYIMEILKS